MNRHFLFHSPIQESVKNFKFKIKIQISIMANYRFKKRTTFAYLESF
jgi:hypothetical protein